MMEHYFYSLAKGADVYNSLNELHRNTNHTSFLVSAVGDLSKVSFKCPLNDAPVIFEKKLEIITLSGYIRSTESHLNISATDENFSVFGVHLLSGTIVLKSLDVLIWVIPNVNKTSLGSSIHNYAKGDNFLFKIIVGDIFFLLSFKLFFCKYIFQYLNIISMNYCLLIYIIHMYLLDVFFCSYI